MMELPPGCSGAHDADFYASTLQQILDADIPFDAVCFKDASGTAVPSKVYETIKRARKAAARRDLHPLSHARDRRRQRVGEQSRPGCGGRCHRSVDGTLLGRHLPARYFGHVARAARQRIRHLDIDIDKVREAEEVFKDCMSDYFLPPEATAVEPLIPWSPMPGGALTANTQMLRDNGIMDKYPEIIAAMSDVVRRGGFGTSVTPVSQFYFQQAFNNVMFGPWKKIAEPYGKMVLGYFGKTPVPPDAEIVKLAREQLKLEPTTRPVLEINDADPNKGLEGRASTSAERGPARDRRKFVYRGSLQGERHRVSQGRGKTRGPQGRSRPGDQCPARRSSTGGQAASAGQAAPAAPSIPTGPSEYTVRVNDREYFLAFEGNTVTVEGNIYHVEIARTAPSTPAAPSISASAAPSNPASAAPSNPASAATATANRPTSAAEEIAAQMPGVILRLLVTRRGSSQIGSVTLDHGGHEDGSPRGDDCQRHPGRISSQRRRSCHQWASPGQGGLLSKTAQPATR